MCLHRYKRGHFIHTSVYLLATMSGDDRSSPSNIGRRPKFWKRCGSFHNNVDELQRGYRLTDPFKRQDPYLTVNQLLFLLLVCIIIITASSQWPAQKRSNFPYIDLYIDTHIQTQDFHHRRCRNSRSSRLMTTTATTTTMRLRSRQRHN